MPQTREAAQFRDPYTIQLGVGSKAVIVIIRHLTEAPFRRFKSRASLAILCRILGVYPGTSSPVARKRCSRCEVDDIEQRPGIIQRVIARITIILRCRIFIIDSVSGSTRIDVRPVRKVVIELFQVRFDRTIIRRNFIFVEFKIEKRAALPVLHVGNLAFHVVCPQIMALTRLDGKALVRAEFSGIGQVGVRLLVKDCFRVQRIILTDAAGTDKRTGTRQSVLAIGSQVLVVRKADIITAVRHIEFFEITCVTHVTIEHVTYLVTGFPGQRGTFKTPFFTFNHIPLHRRIPVVVRCVVVTEVADVETLLLVATELRGKDTGTAATLQRRDNHRENRHRHIGNVQHHRAGSNSLLRFHDHAAAIKVEVLVSRIVTGTKVTSSNLDTRIRQASNFHTVQLLVILVGRRVIYLADTAFHIVLEAHARQGGILRFAEYGFTSRHEHAVFLIKENGVGIQRGCAVFQLCAVIQVEGGIFHIVNKIDGVIFNRIDTGRIVHPGDFRRILFFLYALFQLKARHLLAKRGRSEKDRQCKQQNGPQKTMGSQ